MAPLTAQLQEQIAGAALLVVLMSPDYLASKWCADERDWWLQRQAALGLPHEGASRWCASGPPTPWPAALCDARGEPLVGFAFYPADGVPPRRWAGPTCRAPSAASSARPCSTWSAGSTQARGDARAHRGTAPPARGGRAPGPRRRPAALPARPQRPRRGLGRGGAQAGRQGLRGGAGRARPRRQRSGAPAGRARAQGGDPERLRRPAAARHRGRRALDADLVVVGKHDRQSARARSHRLLPCGLLDTAGATIATNVRLRHRAHRAGGLDRRHRRRLAVAVRDWLGGKGLQAGAHHDPAPRRVPAAPPTTPSTRSSRSACRPALSRPAPFEQHEWPIFFGRERMTDEIVDRLLGHRLLVVHGDSGCGKSSLVRAGVLPRLEQESARRRALAYLHHTAARCAAVEPRACARRARHARRRRARAGAARSPSAARSTSAAKPRRRSPSCSAAARAARSASSSTSSRSSSSTPAAMVRKKRPCWPPAWSACSMRRRPGCTRC